MTNLQVLEKLRARLLKKYAALDSEADGWKDDWEYARQVDSECNGVSYAIAILDELMKELEN